MKVGDFGIVRKENIKIEHLRGSHSRFSKMTMDLHVFLGVSLVQDDVFGVIVAMHKTNMVELFEADRETTWIVPRKLVKKVDVLMKAILL